MTINPLTLFMLASLLLLAFGIIGLTTRRTLVGMLIAVELMLNGAGLSVVAAAKLTKASSAFGEMSAIFIMGLAAAEATIILAMLVLVFRRFGTVEVNKLETIRDAK